MIRGMRVVIVAATLAMAVASASALAAGVDPRVFVLAQADVPRGYEFDKDNSLLVTRAMVDRAPTDDGARALARAGLVNGYFARYTNYGGPRWSYVNSAAFAFRQPKGAKSYLLWWMRSIARSAGPAQRIRLGNEAWLFTASSPDTGTSVLWRHGRVVALVGCLEMRRHRSLALAQARKQERRIAARVS